jgi:predicted small lipoprotein YifL
MMYHKLISLILITLLTGCGQPGPLYLPSKPTPVLVKPQPALKASKQEK